MCIYICIKYISFSTYCYILYSIKLYRQLSEMSDVLQEGSESVGDVTSSRSEASRNPKP